MAKGFVGDYRVNDPVAHLNGLQAVLQGRETGAAAPIGLTDDPGDEGELMSCESSFKEDGSP